MQLDPVSVVGGVLTALAALVVIIAAGVVPARVRARSRAARPVNAGAILGLTGVAQGDFRRRSGRVLLANGETWTAHRIARDTAPEPTDGARVVVVAVEPGRLAVVSSEVAA